MPPLSYELAPSPESLASILHEVRNPLSASMAHAEMLVEGVYGTLSTPQLEAIHTLRQQLQQAFRLMDDLGEIWLGRIPPRSELGTACDGHQLCLTALEQNRSLAESRGLHIDIAAAAGSLGLSSSVVHLDRLVAGIVACGLLLMPKGAQLRLVVRKGETEAFIGLLGEGITAPTAEDTLLETALAQLRRIKPIGLHLLQRWAGLMQGRLVAHATTGGHPALGMVLPASVIISGGADDPAPMPAVLPQSDTKDRRDIANPLMHLNEPPLVLIADDQVALTTVVQTYLEDLGLRVLVAMDGHQAIQYAFSDRPRLIIMDVRMPLLDGLQALEKIRASDDPEIARTAVICVSGYAAPGEQERCLKAGATAFLRKPFGVQHLRDLVHRYFPELETAQH